MNILKKTLVTLTVFLLLFSYPITYYGSVDVIDIEVVDKERVGIDSDTYKFLIYTEDEVFENTDTFWFLKYRSSDLQRDLKIGEQYTVKIVGWRIPFLSKFRNIVKIENE